MNELIFNGKSFSDFNAYVASSNFLDGAQKDVESIAIPGRSGELQLDNRRFHNMTIRTTVYITGNMQQNMAAMRNYLNSCGGYCRYEESLDPDHYRMASFVSAFEPYVYDRIAGAVTLEFNAYPQRWLKSGERSVAITSGASLRNPTMFGSHPVIRVVGSGALNVNDVTITVASNSFSYIDIDCETMDAYCGALNANSYVAFSADDRIVLKTEANGFTFTGFTSVQITPKWFEI